MSVFGSIWSGIAEEKEEMKIIKYKSATEITAEATKKKVLDSLYDSGLSLSFRTYDASGNTNEFHVFYYEDAQEMNVKQSKINLDADF